MNIEATVIELWNKGLTIQDIAVELQLEEDTVEGIVECQMAYLDANLWCWHCHK